MKVVVPIRVVKLEKLPMPGDHGEWELLVLLVGVYHTSITTEKSTPILTDLQQPFY